MPTLMRKVVTVVTGVDGGPYYITGYFDPAVGTAQQNAQAWHTFTLPGPTAGDIPIQTTYTTGPEVQIVEAATGNVVGVDTITPITITGTGNFDKEPPMTQFLVRWLTGFYAGGRQIRGRTFLPGVTNGAVNPNTGRPTDGARNGRQAAAQTLINSANAELLIWSRKNGQAVVVTSSSVWEKFAVLRSRRD